MKSSTLRREAWLLCGVDACRDIAVLGSPYCARHAALVKKADPGRTVHLSWVWFIALALPALWFLYYAHGVLG